MKRKINIYFRKKTKDKHSIENLFDPLIEELKKNNDYIFNKIELPYSNKGLINKIKNILFALNKKADIHHISGDINYISYFFSPKKTIITVHDLNLFSDKSVIKKSLLKIFWIYLPFFFSKQLVAISDTTKKQISSYYSGFESKTIVIPNFVRNEFLTNTKKSDKTNSNTILHIGTKSNKNLERLIEAMNGLDFSLHIIGKLTPRQKELLMKNRIQYHESENISLDEMIDSYLSSKLLHFASLNEGFGLPILEAQCLKIPVITSDIPPMKEIAGQGAMMVNPYSIKEIKNALLKIHEDNNFRQYIINEGTQNVKRYTINYAAAHYITIYNNT